MRPLDEQLDFLRRRIPPDLPHTNGGLLAHLVGTRELLAEWNAGPVLCAAGLYHSVYGTESFGASSVPPSERGAVAQMIGAEAERIVYVFAVMSGESFDALVAGPAEARLWSRALERWIDVDAPLVADLCNLSAANWMEQVPRLDPVYLEVGLDRCLRMLDHVLPAARAAIMRVYRLSDAAEIERAT